MANNIKKTNLKSKIARKSVSITLSLILCFTTAVTAFADTTARTTNTSMNLNGRSGPGTNYSVAIKIPPNSTVTATDSSQNGFTKIKYGGKTCWVLSSYLNYTNNVRSAHTTNESLNLNMRASASSSSRIVKKIPPKSSITTYGNPINGFYYISYGGTKGYVSSDYVSFDVPVPITNYQLKVNEFTSNSKWKNGISWKYGQKPKLSNYSSLGCCAYASDFVKYVFGKNSPRSGLRFTGAGNIKNGDVLHLSPNHWIVVLYRNGNTLTTAEGNASSKVVIKSGKYKISGNKLKTSSQTYTIADGYHFQ